MRAPDATRSANFAGGIDAFALSSPTSDVAVRDLGPAYLIDIRRRLRDVIQASKAGGWDHALRARRPRMGNHQTDVAEQGSRRATGRRSAYLERAAPQSERRTLPHRCRECGITAKCP